MVLERKQAASKTEMQETDWELIESGVANAFYEVELTVPLTTKDLVTLNNLTAQLKRVSDRYQSELAARIRLQDEVNELREKLLALEKAVDDNLAGMPAVRRLILEPLQEKD